MKIKDVIYQLESLIDDRKSFFEVDGDDQIFRDDVKALERAIEIIKKQVEKDEMEMLGKVWINMEYHQQELDRIKDATRMGLGKYQEKSQRTLNYKLSKRELLANMAFGIMGEAGEVIDELKKHLYQGHALDLEHVAEEIGDTMFYIVNLCNLLGLNLETIIEGNYNKLLKRYPDGFDSERSINRNGR